MKLSQLWKLSVVLSSLRTRSFGDRIVSPSPLEYGPPGWGSLRWDSKIWPWVLRDFDPRLTALARLRSNCADSRPVRLVSGLPVGPLTRFYLALLSSSDNFFILLWKAPSLTRKLICSLQCNHSLVRLLTPNNHTLPSHLRLFPFCRLLRLAGTAMEVFQPASTRGFLESK
jgi:hypothetical protein